MHRIIQIAVLVTSHLLISAQLPCQIYDSKNEIKFKREGEISLDDCEMTSRSDCDCRWTFVGVPSEGNNLILNMTVKAENSDSLLLDGENVDWSNNCIVLTRRNLNIFEEESRHELDKLQSRYPGCKISSGIEPPVIVKYQFADNDIPFTIEYYITGDIATPPPETTSSTDAVTTSILVTSPIVTTPDEAELTTDALMTSSPDESSQIVTSAAPTLVGRVGGTTLPQTYTIAIVVGAIAVALIVAVFVMLSVMRRRKETTLQGVVTQNILYDVPEYATINDCKEIPNGKNGGFTNDDVKEEVLNPLYSEFSDESAPVSPLSLLPPTTPRTQNSYEYIDIEIGNR